MPRLVTSLCDNRIRSNIVPDNEITIDSEVEIPKGVVVNINAENRNIVYISNRFIDLNFISEIYVKNDFISFIPIQGERIGIEKPAYGYSYKDVPKVYRRQKYTIVEGRKILKKLNLAYNLVYEGSYDYKSDKDYIIVNQLQTDRQRRLIDKKWRNTCLNIISKWSTNKTNEVDLIIDSVIVGLVKEYFNLNKDNEYVIEEIYQTFGLNIKTIQGILKSVEFKVDDGRIKLI